MSARSYRRAPDGLQTVLARSLHQAVTSDEVLFAPRDGPIEAGFEDRGRFVDIVAIQAQGRLEAKGIARPKTHGDDVGRTARFQKRFPYPTGRIGWHEDLEAIFAGITST